MSQKKAKEHRKNAQEEPKVNHTISIDIYDNGTLRVRDFPAQPAQALQIMHNAAGAVAQHFIRMAAMGDAKKIIPAGPQLVGADGRKLH